MSNSYVDQLIHRVFSTKDRRSMITPELQERMIPDLGGIAREHDIKLISAGGVDDHMNLLLSLSKVLNISKAMQLIKGGSSNRIHETFPEDRFFEWQKGYGAFSIGVSEKKRTIDYINNQAKHHGARDFETEFLQFLDRNEIEYDHRFVFN